MRITLEQKNAMSDRVTYSVWSHSKVDPMDNELVGYFTDRMEAIRECDSNSRAEAERGRVRRVVAHIGVAPLTMAEALDVERELAELADALKVPS
jgi:hypothetical protein